MCIRHSTTYEDDCLDQGGEKKRRSVSSWDTANNESTIKRQRRQKNSFVIDLDGVPPQPPIPKDCGHVKEGASKYVGVYFNKMKNKWVAQLRIEGKQRRVGYYDEEEEAAVDYARALFKYRVNREYYALLKPKGGAEGQIIVNRLPSI
jgi:CTP:phosphocholine cytidylyltransferase-like protein